MKNALKTEVWPPPPKSAIVQPMPEKQVPSWTKWLGLSLASAAFLPALYQWTLVLYRLGLFWLDYKGQLGMNHADDFRDIYTMDVCAVPTSMFAVMLLWRQRGRKRRLSLCILAANILGAGAFFVMHKTGVLVSYSEYIGR
jgi:hypothetical protein